MENDELVKLIKSIGVERGFHGVVDLQDILRSSYNVVVGVGVLDLLLSSNDLFVGDDFNLYKNVLLGNCQAHLVNLNNMSVKAKYENQRIKAVDSYFKNANEMIKLIGICRNKHVVKLGDVSIDKKEEEDEDFEFKFEGEKEEK